MEIRQPLEIGSLPEMKSSSTRFTNASAAQTRQLHADQLQAGQESADRDGNGRQPFDSLDVAGSDGSSEAAPPIEANSQRTSQIDYQA